MGDADDWSPRSFCQERRTRNRKRSVPIKLFACPGAYHGFDVPSLGEGWWLKGPSASTHCLKYDKAAHADSIERVRTFLAAQ